ncbi:sulfotransferase domain-containing protein [Methylomonas fluvii]|uniref:Sulfotransferase domain-containing protein n=1 Tax=Methylomonas fluvii TaxID=1854564 RepID=A0ABR9DH99_9GAMM|nr:sulfotransferase domain-containing protein [Methylomonas fluvii]MBD9362473.1 sulfotransferase domain-containing protein [Methylomonas fluvii]CAD6875577.1 Sulfotransferase [Methylomonas fluvii]
MNGFYWLASYPKSGNTWLRLFLESLFLDGDTPDINALQTVGNNAANRYAFDRVLDIASSDLTDDEITCARPRQYEIEAREAQAPMLRKAHDAWRLTPAGEPLFPPGLTLGAVYIVRDPRDVAVSLAHHMNQTIDQSIQRMCDPEAVMERGLRRVPDQLPQLLMSWSQHARSWLEAPVPLLLLKYEDLLADPATHFGSAVQFLQAKAAPDKIAAAVEAVHFERLRAMEESEGFAEKQPGMERFFRRGIAGGWRDSLSSGQIGRIEADHGDMMHRLGYLP